eukprot:4716985-Pleurochrysis_carterae.AAC.1
MGLLKDETAKFAFLRNTLIHHCCVHPNEGMRENKALGIPERTREETKKACTSSALGIHNSQHPLCEMHMNDFCST